MNMTELKKEHPSAIPLPYWVFGFCLGLGGLIVGSFLDYSIDLHLYHPQTFWAQLLAAYGPLPCFWWLSGLGLSLTQWKEAQESKKTGLLILGILIFAGCLIYVTIAAGNALPLSLFVSAILAIVLDGIPGYFISRQLLKAPEPVRTHMVWCILLVCVGQFVLVHSLKLIVSRPRFLAIVADPNVPFLNWWQNGHAIKQEFSALAASNPDLFKSFPSGHTAAAACSFLGCLLAMTSPESKARPLFVAALIFTCLTACSRMILGYHYLSDVSMGFLIPYTLFALGWKLWINNLAFSSTPETPH